MVLAALRGWIREIESGQEEIVPNVEFRLASMYVWQRAAVSEIRKKRAPEIKLEYRILAVNIRSTLAFERL